MRTLLFSFDDDKSKDQFLVLLEDISKKANNPIADIVKIALNNVKFDQPIKKDSERIVAIFISGQKTYEGQLSEMNKIFEQELAAHSGSVVMKELCGNEWIEIRARRKQQS